MRRISRITRSILAQNARRDFERLTMKLELLRQDPFAFSRGTNPLFLDFLPRAHPLLRAPNLLRSADNYSRTWRCQRTLTYPTCAASLLKSGWKLGPEVL